MKYKYLIFFVLAFFSITAEAQSTFADAQKEVEKWYSTNCVSSVVGKQYKRIEYPAYNYAIEGFIEKNVLKEGTIARFFDTSDPSNPSTLILEGVVTSLSTEGKTIVKGIRYENQGSGPIKKYGYFSAVNSAEGNTVCFKPKKASELQIEDKGLVYVECQYLNYPIVLRKKGMPYLFVDGANQENGFALLSMPIKNMPSGFNQKELSDFLSRVWYATTITYPNGLCFEGKARLGVGNDGAIGIIFLAGKKEGGDVMLATLTEDFPSLELNTRYNSDNSLLYEEKLTLSNNFEGTLKESDYWNRAKYYENNCKVCWTYRNGDCYEGEVQNCTAEQAGDISKATLGKYTYPNGDVFKGNLAGAKRGPFFVDGTTKFADGTTAENDWLAQYELDKSQAQQIYELKTPSEARSLADRFMKERAYKIRSASFRDYVTKRKVEIDYFYSQEVRSSEIKTITYDIKKGIYRCMDKNGEIKLDLTVDSEFHHLKEVVYREGQPKYTNIFTWYSNGKVESIRTYEYDSNRLCFFVTFFTNGHLKSAYEYEIVNGGENVLRKSKEYSASRSKYVSKSYDLNGNYEQNIEWRIGEAKLWIYFPYDWEWVPDELKSYSFILYLNSFELVTF